MDVEDPGLAVYRTEVRRAVEDDWDGFRAHFETLAAERRFIAADLPVDWDARRPSFEVALSGVDALMLVADDAGEVVGHLILRLDAGRAQLGMGVSATHRGAGLGRRLLEQGIDWARAAGAHKVVLEAWPHNEAAVALYERFGFELEGRHRRHWRRSDGSLWDSVSMGLVLDETSPGSPY